jgi:acetylornithine/succinyldiaminopimelate/putrescine aminotransferase
MMILDEIQPGFDEQEPFGFQNYDVVPDIVVMGKEWWCMPVGAFTASSDMILLSTNPKLGHITTFGDILSLRQLVWLL